MDTDSAPRTWAKPVLVTLAMLAPSAVPSSTGPAADAAGWLLAGTAQSLSQFALLLVIIGASGALREYGVSRPAPSDAFKAGFLLIAITLASRLSALAIGLAGLGGEAARAFIPSPAGARPAEAVALAALFSVAVALREELFYRLYVIGSLRERGTGGIPAILVSTLLFAAGHAYQGPQGIASSLLMGAAMALATVKGYGLFPLAAAHATYNFLVLLAAFGM
ncbi:MAG: CPBP family intramembrane metalloprotease [Spirochaetes bacterium]|nr:CPBP family intramembrane metalloprotease [Spirochaetota bacterium]MBU1080359.1 CPBP family intramembrane metalloprotease [Spirochaetota bacterium]